MKNLLNFEHLNFLPPTHKNSQFKKSLHIRNETIDISLEVQAQWTCPFQLLVASRRCEHNTRIWKPCPLEIGLLTFSRARQRLTTLKWAHHLNAYACFKDDDSSCHKKKDDDSTTQHDRWGKCYTSITLVKSETKCCTSIDSQSGNPTTPRGGISSNT